MDVDEELWTQNLLISLMETKKKIEKEKKLKHRCRRKTRGKKKKIEENK